ncbi:hypothetical protein Zm00014a_006884 [Zea mays]|uniref:Uncharacterized protein n=1 Tax=Zea mays TaxID=4577 RepID=A0A3L6FPB7_MAIZE|nr:hypothetical protein Zm00014a_006884 [Zea mays]
MQKGCFKPMTQ